MLNTSTKNKNKFTINRPLPSIYNQRISFRSSQTQKSVLYNKHKKQIKITWYSNKTFKIYKKLNVSAFKTKTRFSLLESSPRALHTKGIHNARCNFTSRIMSWHENKHYKLLIGTEFTPNKYLGGFVAFHFSSLICLRWTWYLQKEYIQ